VLVDLTKVLVDLVAQMEMMEQQITAVTAEAMEVVAALMGHYLPVLVAPVLFVLSGVQVAHSQAPTLEISMAR
jgi:hypothetical protein